MTAQKHINQLDPFGENEGQYKTKEIRHSRSRSKKNPFLLKTEDGSNKRNFIILASVLIVIILGSVLFIIFSASSHPDDSGSDGSPIVNPTGRESSATSNLNDPDVRANEQAKLETSLAFAAEENWSYSEATFKTIFPDYLDACGKYDYYRLAVMLSENIKDFAISREHATERMQSLLEKCNRSQKE